MGDTHWRKLFYFGFTANEKSKVSGKKGKKSKDKKSADQKTWTKVAVFAKGKGRKFLWIIVCIQVYELNIT